MINHFGFPVTTLRIIFEHQDVMLTVLRQSGRVFLRICVCEHMRIKGFALRISDSRTAEKIFIAFGNDFEVCPAVELNIVFCKAQLHIRNSIPECKICRLGIRSP